MPTQLTANVQPRILRMKDAPGYLGMNKNYFNEEVRPSLTELRFGTQGIAFDRNELDAWADDLVSRSAKTNPTATQFKTEKKPCQKNSQASSKGASYGTSTKSSKEEEFAKALERATSKKRKTS